MADDSVTSSELQCTDFLEAVMFVESRSQPELESDSQSCFETPIPTLNSSTSVGDRPLWNVHSWRFPLPQAWDFPLPWFVLLEVSITLIEYILNMRFLGM
ncbi:hypothetical protein CIPAW_02G022000 [Carya illinoinensis]|uniref:Uncharacterized protein n=1 Tax=Carya illinoinensis TaxID=32201 RepID=A0A8T1R7M1_CARIL|nr:hypothetical protein CIPAW_02G022000 [Carya illinoinensis]